MALRAVDTKPMRARSAKAPARTTRLSSVDHLAAQAELDAALFPHYLLGRQLALEEVVRELLLATPADVRAAVVDKLKFSADQAMERLQEHRFADNKEEASLCGYTVTLLQQGA